MNQIFKNFKILHKLFNKNIQSFGLTFPRSKYHFSGEALVSLANRGDEIACSIVELAKKKEIYSGTILLRSLIEHQFRHTYIYSRALSEQSDVVGKDYILYLLEVELKSYADALNRNDKIFLTKQTFSDRLAELPAIPELKNVTQKELDIVNAKFGIKNIISYLNSRPSAYGNGQNKYLQQIIPLYSNYSSFVHGGPFGASVFKKTKEDRKRLERDSLHLVRTAHNMSCTMVLNTMRLASLLNAQFIPTIDKCEKLYAFI
ncbi:DUF5677 domain-containing protein [Leptospira wolffii]|uniref:DUF5677 domain-containing protein n=1 Tax=Leptospira wolffii TaxID=409998 RepID=UPI00059004F7|nr:DUF5677 domain-containing protein [Leptospira wolffii]